MPEPLYPPVAFLWPWLAAASAGEAALNAVNELALRGAPTGEVLPVEKPSWTTPHAIALELPTMQLRDFSGQEAGTPLVICAPFALHGSTIADFAPHHSLVAALRQAGHKRVSVTDWRSATPEMSEFTIDTYLADLNVAIDEMGAPVNLIGLCQGGWMSLVYAARFPHKVRRLVIAGAPVDIAAGCSALSRAAAMLPLSIFQDFVRQGAGRVIGQRMLRFWAPEGVNEDAIRTILQCRAKPSAHTHDLENRFRAWHDWTVDLPGRYYLQVIEWLFKENRIAQGRFVALGKTIDLLCLRLPLYLLAARDDEIVAPEQLLALSGYVGTSPEHIEQRIEPCGHLALFMGADTLKTAWTKIARWLHRSM